MKLYFVKPHEMETKKSFKRKKNILFRLKFGTLSMQKHTKGL